MAAWGFGAGKVWKGGEKGRSEILQKSWRQVQKRHMHTTETSLRHYAITP